MYTVVIMHVISHTKDWRFNHTHKEDHTSKREQQREKETEEKNAHSLLILMRKYLYVYLINNFLVLALVV